MFAPTFGVSVVAVEMDLHGFDQFEGVSWWAS